MNNDKLFPCMLTMLDFVGGLWDLEQKINGYMVLFGEKEHSEGKKSLIRSVSEVIEDLKGLEDCGINTEPVKDKLRIIQDLIRRNKFNTAKAFIDQAYNTLREQIIEASPTTIHLSK